MDFPVYDLSPRCGVLHDDRPSQLSISTLSSTRLLSSSHRALMSFDQINALGVLQKPVLGTVLPEYDNGVQHLDYE